MSVPGTSATSVATAGLPAASQALEPKWVRDGSASTQQAYETALAFEQTLVEQLSQSLAKSSGLGGEGGQEGAPGSGEGGGEGDSELSMLLPQALTSGVMDAGGLGLAAQLTQQLAAEQGDATNSAGAGSPSAGSGAGAAGATSAQPLGAGNSAGTQPLGAGSSAGAQLLGAAGGVDAPRGASS